ncbi:hypothetical protein AB0B31_32680 [Catellatospora citrea]|uniref:hypothetical protein n=1 Tax=Catellatospora citrea TaxID=53366 RepID=UPI0033CE0BA0
MPLETVTQARVDGETTLDRLMCHPRLPLIAGWDSARPAVHIWDHADGTLRACDIVGGHRLEYRLDAVWERFGRVPAAAWHPHEPLLTVAAEGEVTQWNADGESVLAAVPARAGYRDLAFSPDGHALWASPAMSGGDDEDDWWESSDVIDLVSGAVRLGPRWDTGVAEHPGGGLVATLRSDQGATYVAFARPDTAAGPAMMRQLSRTLILSVDGYETPVFSADGRHFAIRGNAYEHTLEVFAFPSLERVLGTTLGPPCPGYPYPEEWEEQVKAWSRHNIAFGLQPGVLWIGTPQGVLVQLDVHADSAAEHDVLAGAPVTALAVTATGALVVADGAGGLRILSLPNGPEGARAPAREVAQAQVDAFTTATFEVAHDADWEDVAVRTDGSRTWHPEDLDNLTDSTESDPPWLQIRAAVNRMGAGRDPS